MSVALCQGRLRQCFQEAAQRCLQLRGVSVSPPPTPHRPSRRAASTTAVPTTASTAAGTVASSPPPPSPPPLEYASACSIPTTWLDFPLIAKADHTHDSTLYTFGLPATQSLNLPACACILMRAVGRGRVDGGGKDDWDGSDAVRPYTPVSSNSVLGSFDLCVKRYQGGAASEWLHELPIGKTVGFKHIKFNIKAQYPWEGKRKLAMLCAGTGVTPMIQALHAMQEAEDDREVRRHPPMNHNESPMRQLSNASTPTKSISKKTKKPPIN